MLLQTINEDVISDLVDESLIYDSNLIYADYDANYNQYAYGSPTDGYEEFYLSG